MKDDDSDDSDGEDHDNKSYEEEDQEITSKYFMKKFQRTTPNVDNKFTYSKSKIGTDSKSDLKTGERGSNKVVKSNRGTLGVKFNDWISNRSTR